jgi:hypothetical protein
MLRTAEAYAEIAEKNVHHIIIFPKELKLNKVSHENEVPCLL